jgi:hypothetical protein
VTIEDPAYRPRTKNRQFGIMLALAVVGGLTLGLGLLVLLGVEIVRRPKAARLARRMEDAARRLATGEVSEPARELDDVARHARFLPALHTAALFHRAVAFLREGEFARSAALFEIVHSVGWLESRRRNLVGHTAAMRAECEALRGDVTNARVWLEKARSAVRPAKKGVLVLPEVLIALRDGRHEEAAGIVAMRSSEAEAANDASSMRALRVLAGYALARSVIPPTPQTVTAMIAAARPFRRGELDYLAVAWPDLEEFLVAHGFIEPKVMSPLAL